MSLHNLIRFAFLRMVEPRQLNKLTTKLFVVLSENFAKILNSLTVLMVYNIILESYVAPNGVMEEYFRIE